MCSTESRTTCFADALRTEDEHKQKTLRFFFSLRDIERKYIKTLGASVFCVSFHCWWNYDDHTVNDHTVSRGLD